MRELTLVIAGLLWPADSLPSVGRDLSLPALETLLAHGGATARPATTLEEALAGLWGLPPDSAPYAALRVAGSGGDPGDASWMCVDPAHLRFARETLVLTDNRELDIEADEALQLVAALNATFADVGEFTVASPGEWNLRLRKSPQLATHPIAHVLGRSIEPVLPSGADGAEWRRTINEIQMLLHTHPVNEAREAAGRPAINSIWPWGTGSLTVRIEPRHATVFADMALARGLSLASGSVCAALPERLPQSAGGTTLAVLDQLHYPALALNVEAWQMALKRLESAWFRPALDALKRRQLDHVRLFLIGDTACVDVQCDDAAWWKFWKRPLPLETFVRSLAPP